MTSTESDTTVVGEWSGQAAPDLMLSLGDGARYAVIEEVGRGGMGRVLRAYDPALQREVALKEVHDDVLDPASKARLVSEARAMAKLSHPNVVAVYDVEVAEPRDEDPGGVRIVMEFVPGETLRDWLTHARTWKEVLDVFIAAGRGLSAAHHRGLIHRDFKPANVLVGAGDPPIVKVTDFGIAKTAGEDDPSAGPTKVRSTSQTLTRAGTVVGTPRYMAPEQHAGKALTPAADQFAFCVALWEALVGEAPFSGPTLGEDKWRGPPDWRTVTRQSSPADPTRAKALAMEVPKRVASALERGLAPQPADRWPSMEHLLEQLEPPQPERRRALLLGGALVVAVGAGASIWAVERGGVEQCTGAQSQFEGVWGVERAADVRQAMTGIERPYAERAWKDAQRTLDAFAARWVDMHTESCLATSRGEQSSEALDLRMSCLSRAKQRLNASVDVLADADEEVVERSHTILADLPDLERCADVEALRQASPPPVAADEPAIEATRALVARVHAQEAAGRYQPAMESVEAAERAFEGIDYAPVAAELAYARGGIELRLGHLDESVESFERAQTHALEGDESELLGHIISREVFALATYLHREDEARRLMPIFAGLATKYPRSLEPLYHTAFAGLYVAEGSFEEAAAQYRAAIERFTELEGPESLTVATHHSNLGMALRRLGKYEESEAELRRALAVKRQVLGEGHPSVANTLQALGTVLNLQDRKEESEESHLLALEIRREALPESHPMIANSHNALGILYKNWGDYETSERYLRKALDLSVRSLDPDHPHVADAYNNLGNLLRRTGELEEAETLHRKALDIKLRVLGEQHPSTADSYNNLGTVLRAAGKLEESEQMQRLALATAQEVLGPRHPSTSDSHGNLGNLLRQMGKLDEAREHHELCLEIRLERNGDEGYRVANARSDFAELALDQGDVELALELSSKAWGFYESSEASSANDRALAAFVHARALARAGRRSESDTLVERAIELAEEAGVGGTKTLGEIEAWNEASP